MKNNTIKSWQFSEYDMAAKEKQLGSSEKTAAYITQQIERLEKEH